MDELFQNLLLHPWAVWIAIAIVAGLIEVAVPSFSFLFMAMASILAAAVSVYVPFLIQSAIFAIALVAMVFFMRPYFLKRGYPIKHMPSHMSSRSQELVGAKGKVTEIIDPQSSIGRVSVNGQDWAAQSQKLISVGSTVIVEKFDGIVLIVREE